MLLVTKQITIQIHFHISFLQLYELDLFKDINIIIYIDSTPSV